MSFRLHHRKHIESELEEIVRRQLRDTAKALTTSRDREFRNVVHESRKSVKKVRAIAALLKTAGTKVPRRDRRRLKSAARALSTVRDSAAIVETFERLHHRYPRQLPEHTYGVLRRGLVAARDRLEARERRDGVVRDAAAGLKKTARSARTWAPRSITWKDMTGIVGASYRKSRVAMTDARATGQSATYHRWRKAVKTLRYQLRLLRGLTTGLAPLVRELDRLESALGDDHNLVVLEATLRGCPDLRSMRGDIRHIGQLAVRMRDSLRRRAFRLGRRLHTQPPKAFASRIRASFDETRVRHKAARR